MTKQVVSAGIREDRSADPGDVLGSRLKGGRLQKRQGVNVHPKFGTVTSVNYADVAQAKGNNLSTGAKIAIGIGIGAAAVLIILLIYISCCTG